MNLASPGHNAGVRSVASHLPLQPVVQSGPPLRIEVQHERARALFRAGLGDLDLEVHVLYVGGRETRRFHLESYTGMSDHVAKDIRTLSPACGLAGAVSVGAEMIIAEGIQHSYDPVLAFERSLGLKASVCHPLVVNGQLLGVIELATRKRAELCRAELEQARLLSSLVALAVYQERAATTLRDTEAGLRRALDFGDVGVWDWDVSAGKFWFAGFPALGLDQSGGSEDQKRLLKVVHPRDRERVVRAVSRCLESGDPFEFETQAVCSDATVRWVDCRGRGHYDETSKLTRVTGVVTDATERRQRDEQLSRMQEEARELTHMLDSVREDERRRIARTVHDDLGQTLTALKMQLWRLTQSLPVTDPAAAEKARSMSELIDRTIETVQRIALDLRPGVLDDLG
jgi:signal transduction histidine kinase